MRIYNTLAGKKEPFKPIRKGSVKMYVCGVTVYDLCHLGHARSAIVFDMIRRYFNYKGYRVKYVRNFTDVDDKIINRANQEGKGWREVAEKYIHEYSHDMNLLGVKPATIEPKATEHIPEMIQIIQKLIKRGMAYVVDGNVYFKVARFSGYGKLSKRKLDEMLAGARVEVDECKQDPLDFALWKASKPGEPTWESPWGPGRPGWHIECSAMAIKHLGSPFDIHGGGKDLIFPHHENEIAQSEGSTGKDFVHYWIHNGFVTIDQEKMSKSLGNFFTIREIFQKSSYSQTITAEVLRYFLLSTHYRSPIDFSDQSLTSAKSALDNFYVLFVLLGECKTKQGKGDKQLEKDLKTFKIAFEKAMDDDFNTAGAIAQLQKLRSQVNRALDLGLSAKATSKAKETILKYGAVLALLQVHLEEWKRGHVLKAEPGQYQLTGAPAKLSMDLNDEAVNKLVEERNEARRQRDWARADAIRKQLAEAGITLEDRPDGTSRVRS
ncbi:MAG: cysteine--tRNA ligase [Nitrospira sp.]|nr:cysteine--tRNA ligase [Nitrospira sp.]